MGLWEIDGDATFETKDTKLKNFNSGRIITWNQKVFLRNNF